MRFAYADPPYPGRAYLYPERKEVDHEALIRRLYLEYPDGWALSTRAKSLKYVWDMCPEAELFIWIKGHVAFRKCLRCHGSYEALLISGGRLGPASINKPLNSLIYRGRHRSMPGAMIGMKPPAFAEWMFRLLGAAQGDALDDLFPGSGAIGVAWARFTDPHATVAMKRVACARAGEETVSRAPATRGPGASDESSLQPSAADY